MAAKLHPNIELGELKLKISNLERSLKFYEEVIGLKLLKREGQSAWMTVDGQTALLVLEEVPGAVIMRPRTTSGLYHFAILLPTREDLGLSLRRLLEFDIEVGQADHLVSEALYLSDPDHNGIEIYRDRPREEWQYDEQGYVKMTTDPIDWEGLLELSKDSIWQGMPAGTKIGHVHFHVSDLRKARAFYCDAVGFDVEADIKRMGALFIGAGGYHHHIGLNIWAGAGAPNPPANATGIEYFTIVFPNETALKETLGSLRQAGIAVGEDGGVTFIEDPSGIKVRLKSA